MLIARERERERRDGEEGLEEGGGRDSGQRAMEKRVSAGGLEGKNVRGRKEGRMGGKEGGRGASEETEGGRVE